MENNNTKLCEGTGTFTKKGDVDYDINLPGAIEEKEYDFFGHYDISSPNANRIVILVKPELAVTENDAVTKKHNHKFKIKNLKRYNGSTGFDVNKNIGTVVVINCNQITDEVTKIIDRFLSDSTPIDRPVLVGTGIIRKPLE
jgi:hypothetical protein